MELSEKANKLKIGEYEHYKGNRYKVLGVVNHSETLEELVIYQKLYDDGGIWGASAGYVFRKCGSWREGCSKI